MRYLRTNTATRVTMGPFLDKTDGVTEKLSLTVTSEKLTMTVDVAGVPTLVLDTNPTASGGANDMVHITGDDAGLYDLELAAANLNYLGRARVVLANAAVHCPVWEDFMIVPQWWYDSMVLGISTSGPVEVFGIIEGGVAGSCSATQLTTRTVGGSAPPADLYKDRALWMVGIGVVTIDASSAADPTVLTFNTPAITPTGTPQYYIGPQASQSTTNPPGVNVTKWAATTVPAPSTAGVPLVDVVRMLGTLFTESAAGRLVAAIKKFFDVATPTSTLNQITLVDTTTNLTNSVGGGDSPGVTTLLTRVPALVPVAADYSPARAAKLDNADVATSTRLATSGYTVPPTTAAIADKVLGRHVQGAADGPANQSVSAALAAGLMKFSIAGTPPVLTLQYPDGTTILTRTLTRAEADAIQSAA